MAEQMFEHAEHTANLAAAVQGATKADVAQGISAA
jgi:hypothetical protein